jgi:dTDP-4-amino-4,6-dideoxygalactose transaminase
MLNSKKMSRNALVAKLKEFNIHAREAFPRMSQFPMYTARFANPVATSVAKDGFNLPSAFNITEKDVDYVCTVLLSLIT